MAEETIKLEEITLKGKDYREKSTGKLVEIVWQSGPLPLETGATASKEIGDHILQKSRSEVIFGNGYIILENTKNTIGVRYIRYRLLRYKYLN